MKSLQEYLLYLIEDAATVQDVEIIKKNIQLMIGKLYKEKVLDFFIDDLSGDPSLTINYFSSKRKSPVSTRRTAKNIVAIIVELENDKKARTRMINAKFSGINSKKAKRMTPKEGSFNEVSKHITTWFKQQKDNIWEE